MSVFGIMIHGPDDRVSERLRQKYDTDRLYEISPTTILLRTRDLAEDVAVTAGIKGEERIVTGVVFKLDRAYAGYTSRSLWEWLQLAETE